MSRNLRVKVVYREEVDAAKAARALLDLARQMGADEPDNERLADREVNADPSAVVTDEESTK